MERENQLVYEASTKDLIAEIVTRMNSGTISESEAEFLDQIEAARLLDLLCAKATTLVIGMKVELDDDTGEKREVIDWGGYSFDLDHAIAMLDKMKHELIEINREQSDILFFEEEEGIDNGKRFFGDMGEEFDVD